MTSRPAAPPAETNEDKFRLDSCDLSAVDGSRGSSARVGRLCMAREAILRAGAPSLLVLAAFVCLRDFIIPAATVGCIRPDAYRQTQKVTQAQSVS